MRVWLLKIGEAIPTDRDNPRPLRTGFLADILSERGHDVTWWTSTFEHRSRTHRAQSSVTHDVRPNYRLRLLHSRGYARSISVERLVDHRQVARAFVREAENAERPNVIVCAYPTIDLAVAAVRYGRRYGVPVVLDVRDLWPDIFLRAAPGPLRPAARLGLIPFYRSARFAFANATGVTGITAPIVDWGLRYAGRPRRSTDGDFPLAYEALQISTDRRDAAHRYWEQRGIPLRNSGPLVAYLGGLHSTLDFSPVVEAARQLVNRRPDLRFVICGTGMYERELREMSRGLTNIDFPGWVGRDALWTLMEAAKLGLLCYKNSFDFEMSIPNKAIEYMAGGMAVMSSVRQGILSELLLASGAGVVYRDASELVGHISRFIDNPAELETASVRARAVFEARFRADRVYGAMADHVESLARTWPRSIDAP